MIADKKIPLLRFPEFEDEWEGKKIKNLYKNLSTGSTPSRLIKEYFQGDIPWITSGELNYNRIYKTKECISSAAVKATNLKMYPPGTFFIAITGLEAPGTRGRCAINSVVSTTNQSCLAFQKIDDVDNNFLFYWYSKFGVALYYEYAQGTKQQSFNNEIVGRFNLTLPTVKEQQKIAGFLTAIDDKMQQLTKKKALLEDYKKGVMQQIFSQQIRFKDDNGNDYPVWKEKHLSDIADITSSKRVYLSNYVENGILFFRGKEITELKINKKPLDVLYISNDAYENFKNKFGAPTENDILVTAVGTLGNTYRVRAQDKFYFKDGNLIWFRNIIENSSFLEYLLDFNKPELDKTAIGSSQKALTIVGLKKLKLMFPIRNEQQKIANFLTSIDDKINEVNNQLEQTQQYKKGLLQQMFV